MALDTDPQVDAVLACLPTQPATLTHHGLTFEIRLIHGDPRPLAATIAARVLRSVADQYPTSGMIPIGTLRHMADDLEDGAS